MTTVHTVVTTIQLIVSIAVAPPPEAKADNYALLASGSRTLAANPAQGFDALIDSDTVGVQATDRSWHVDLALLRIGRGGAMDGVQAAGVEVHDAVRAELHRGDLVEWYVNSAQGLEQGFTVLQRPPGGGPLVLEMFLSGSLVPRLADRGRSVAFFHPGESLAVLSYSKLKVEDTVGQVMDSWLELQTTTGQSVLRIIVDDTAARYPLRVDPLISTAQWSSAETARTTSLAWGDWDGDGDLDLATGSAGQPNRVYTNSSGTLTLSWSSADSDKTYSVAWGDVDGDGDLDLAAGNSGQPNRIYLNSSDTLTSVWQSVESDVTHSVAWGDWDGDGDLDLAVGNNGDPNRVYDNPGGPLSVIWSSSDSDDTYSVAWGDWDDDGDLDLAAGNVGQPNRVYSNWAGNLSSSWTSADSDDTHSVAWGDWVGDGHLDLAAGNSDQPNRIYENTGGDLDSGWTANDSDDTRSVAFGDWDSDGDLDLAAGNYNQPNRVYERRDGSVHPSSAWTSTEADRTLAVAWGDWNGDGDLDLAAGSYDQPDRVYQGSGMGLHAVWSVVEEGLDAKSVAWGDWDGDGDLDLAVSVFAGANRVYRRAFGELSLVWISSDSDKTQSVAWGDWDGDGDLDLAAGNKNQPNRVYENTNDTLTSVWTSADSDSTRDISWGDWDGDGDLDLAAANRDQPNRVYENTGGDLESAWTSIDSDASNEVVWGDWDGDGDLDLAVANSGQANRVYSNTGGDLVSVWTSDDTDATTGVAWGDWDGDGDLDLAAANWEQPTRVYESFGGDLDSAWISAEDEHTIAVAWGDWDGDGDLDLAAANASSPNRVYVNTGGDLESAWTPEGYELTRDVAWGDWDGDGDLDLAVAAWEAVRIFANGYLSQPGGLPETPTTAVLSERPGTAAAASGYSSAERLGSPVTIPYTLVDEQGDPASRVVAEYSTNGGGLWLPATGSTTTNLTASANGVDHTFEWDAIADGVTRADNVVFRITVPTQDPDAVGGGLQRGALAAVSPPFRVAPVADLEITVSGDQSSVVPGESLGLTIISTNLGPVDVVGARIVDELDWLEPITWTCTSEGGAHCSDPTGTDDIDQLVDLPAGGTVTFTVSGTLLAHAHWLSDTYDNAATIDPPAGVADCDRSNNSASESLPMTPEVDLTLSNTDGQATAEPGTVVTYTILVSNAGPGDAALASVTDVFPTVLTGVTWSSDGSQLDAFCHPSSGTGDVLTEAYLPVGSVVTLTASGTVDPGATGVLSNTASVAPRAGTTDTNPADNSATDNDPLVSCDVDRSGSCDAGDIEWVLSCADDPLGCGCPGDPDMNGDLVVDADDLNQLVLSVF